MLLLTTIFIDVSNSLPKTTYIKMVDIWLLFNLLLPFMVVLIHTRMDTLRMDDEDRLTKEELSLVKSKDKKVAFWKKISLVYNPIMFLSFVTVYWMVGLRHAEVIWNLNEWENRILEHWIFPWYYKNIPAIKHFYYYIISFWLYVLKYCLFWMRIDVWFTWLYNKNIDRVIVVI